MSLIRRHEGFTLLELLVALAIFAFLAAVMYSGTQLVIEEREVVALRLEELRSMQQAVRVLQTDFSELYPRSVRDELGRGQVAALITERRGELLIQLTRNGWRNPAGAERGNLQRVQYRFDPDKGVLYRDYWPVLERVLGAEPREQELLQGLTEFEIEFLDASGTWLEDWPPASAQGFTSLPRAVRYRMELESYGEITRLVEIPG